jgi:hypothetical protein
LRNPRPRSIRSAMSQRIDHTLQIRAFPPANEAGNSAHED